MGIIQKQGSLSTAINYAGIGIAYINLIIILPAFLSLEQIGLMRAIIEVAMLLMLVFQFGSPYLVIRFFPRYKDSDRITRAFYTLAVLFSLFGLGTMFVFYITFREPILDYFSSQSTLIYDFERPILLIAGSLILFNVFERIFSSKKIIVVPTFFKEWFFRFGQTVAVSLIGLKMIEFSMGINIWVATYLIGPLALLYLYKKRFGLKFTFQPEMWNKKTLQEFAAYSAVITLGAIGGGLSLKLDIVMLIHYLGLDAVGIYGTIVYIATVIEVPKRALVQISDPFISEYYTEGRMDKIGELYKKNSVVLLVFGFFLFLGIYACLPYLFEIMPKGKEFSIGMNVFLIISGVKLMSLLSGITNQILLNSVEAWISSATVFVLALMAVVLNYVLIPKYGLEGAALATFIAVGVNHALTMGYVFWKFKIHPFCRELLVLTIISAILFAGLTQLPHLSNPWVGMFVHGGVIAVVYPLLVWRLKLSADSVEMVESVLRKIRSRA